MLQKKSLAGRKVEVTFRMPPLDDVVELYLCGDFNGWQVKGIPLHSWNRTARGLPGWCWMQGNRIASAIMTTRDAGLTTARPTRTFRTTSEAMTPSWI